MPEKMTTHSEHLNWEQRCERTKEVHLFLGLAKNYWRVFIILLNSFSKHHSVQFLKEAHQTLLNI